MTKTYLIRLRPTGRFFFGGEQTFGEGAIQSYLARSNYFPQQTTILGMLRYELLCRKKYLPVADHPASAEALIGPRSFQANNNQAADFGVIERLSPVFIYKGRQVLYPTPADKRMGVIYRQHPKPAGESNPEAVYRFDGTNKLRKGPMFDLEGFDPKEYKPPTLTDLATGNTYAMKDIFKENSQVGITKGEGGQTATEAFYRMFAYQFTESDMGFCCWLQLADEWPEAERNSLVFLGAERAMFQLSVQEANWQTDVVDAFGVYTDKSSAFTDGLYRVVLLGDTRVSASMYDYCDFALSDTVSFRHIETTLKQTTQYHRMKRVEETDITQPAKTEARLHLLLRGAVLWTRQPAMLIEQLKAPAFEQIGYNLFQIQAC